jgi:4-amino-4-deoxy-L-arabinose transferase-like glycosyltransferase
VPAASPTDAASHRTLLTLLLAAALLFTANAERLPLPALDDCFYAQKGVEMNESGSFFNVTWNHLPTFQNPPLPFWIQGRAFALLGENDLAARLPAILMALGLVVLTWRIGSMILGRTGGLDAAALLLVTPLFLNHARRSMLDLPFAFWSAAMLWVALEGFQRPQRHLVLALPLGAALLTKSVLALVPLATLFVIALVLPTGRRSLRTVWPWLGVAFGLAAFATWPVSQYRQFGPGALREHFITEIATRSTHAMGILLRVFEYPLLLLQHFEPLALLAIPGAVMVVQRMRARAHVHAGVVPYEPLELAPVLWCGVPLILCSLSSAHSARYLFPMLPGLAVCAAFLIGRLPALARHLRTWVVPVVLVVGAALFWFAPETLGRYEAMPFKRDRATLAAALPAGQPVAYVGSHYWSLASPFMYYVKRELEKPIEPFEMRSRRGTAVLADRDRLDAVTAAEPGLQVVYEGPAWVLLRPASR